MLSDFHFLRPVWFAGLLLIPLAWWLRRYLTAPETRWRQFVDPALLPHVLADPVQQPSRRRWLLPLLTGAYALAVTALAGPAWQRLPQPLYNDRSALVILLDLSKSMDAQDVRPSRLARARFKIADLLARRGTGLTALIVYAADAYAVVPLTDDVATIASQLPVLETSLMPAQGSRPERAVQRALAFLKDAGLSRGDLLLVTDALRDEDAAATQSLLGGQAVRVSFLAVGTAAGAPIPAAGGGFIRGPDDRPVLATVDDAAMKRIAAATGGQVRWSSADDSDVSALAAVFSGQSALAAAQRTDRATQQWREEGPWLLLPLLPLAALAFRRGVLLVALIACLQCPPPANAATWADLWATPDQRGQRAFDAGDPAAAARHFEDRRWQAAARYRAGDFAGAVDALGGASTSDDHYNRGNALVRSGKYADAIAAYEQALKIDPGNADARSNLNLIRQLQQQSSSQQGGGKSDPAQGDGKQSAQNNPAAGEQAQKPSAGNERGHDDQGQPRPQPSDNSPGKDDVAKSPEGGDRKLDELLARREAQAEQQARESKAPEPSPSTDEQAGKQPPPDHQRERDQADEQWLRRIPDDPGGLLRRKFYYQYSQSSQTPPSDTPW